MVSNNSHGHETHRLTRPRGTGGLVAMAREALFSPVVFSTLAAKDDVGVCERVLRSGGMLHG